MSFVRRVLRVIDLLPGLIAAVSGCALIGLAVGGAPWH